MTTDSWIDRLGNPKKNTFDAHSVAGLLFGVHSTISILFVIPEAVGAINGHNTAILTELQKLGRVDTITQADALTYPHFAGYNMVFCGTDNGTVWVAANLAHVKEFPEPVICVDATVAAYLLIGTDGGDAAAKTVLTAITEIKANDLGIGDEGITGLAVGANTISSATIYNTLDMSDADITETFFGTEAAAVNTDVLLGAVFKRQPDSTRGILSDGSEATGSRYFFGPAYSAADLNTLGLAVIELIGHMAIQTTTAAVGIEISGDIGDLETKLFGNQATEFNNGNPLIEYLTGRNSSGTRLPVGKSIYDLLGIGYLDGAGGFNLENLRDDLRTLAQYLIDGDAGAEVGGALASGVSLPDMITTLTALVDDLEGRLTAARAGYLDELDFDLQGLLNTIAGYIDAEIGTIITSQGRQLFSLDFWSEFDEEVQVAAAAGTLALANVTVADLPAGATVVRAIAMFKCRMIENIYAGVNKLDGATVATTSQVIQVRDDTPGTWRDAINFVDDQFTLADTAREGGDVLIGQVDIAVEVDGNDTYNFQWLLANADQDFINFNDVQVGLRIWYSV